MNRATYVLALLCMWGIDDSFLGKAAADNGKVVTGTVIAIDPANQIMRVYVTGVDGQPLYGSPQTNYVDYLVSVNTVVVGPYNQFVSQSNVLVGSQIQMQFAGPHATAIVLLGNGVNAGEYLFSNVNSSPNNNQYLRYLSAQNVSHVHHRVSRPAQSTHRQTGSTVYELPVHRIHVHRTGFNNQPIRLQVGSGTPVNFGFNFAK